MTLGLTEKLPSLVGKKFSAAQVAKHLIFSSTELTVIRTSTGIIPFQLRFCPALAEKPTAPNPSPKPPARKFDPFENPSPELLVANVPEGDYTHRLVLNKYPVIKDHFILATKENKPQTHALEEQDLAVAFDCITQWQEDSDGASRLFAFFNSGEHSGASQPHRHLQFLPVESMSEQDGGEDWNLLADTIIGSMADVPFASFSVWWTSDPTPEQLHKIYLDLYQSAEDSVRQYVATGAGDLELHPTDGGDLPISYNLAMTADGMIIMPRRREGIPVRTDGAGLVALNGTVLSGSLMVKDKIEYELLKDTPEVLEKILESIGIPPKKTETTDKSSS